MFPISYYHMIYVHMFPYHIMTSSKYPQQRPEWYIFIESLELYMFNVEGLMP